MPLWPKSFLTIGASVLTARTAWRIRSRDRGTSAQQRTYRRLVSRMATTQHWKSAGVQGNLPYDGFRAQVPVRTYAGFVPAIERVLAGEPNVLWPGQCLFVAASAGTTTGVPKRLPVTPEMFAHYRVGARDAVFYYTARTGHTGVFGGRHLFLTGSTALRVVDGGGARPYVGEWAAIAALNLPRWAERQLFEPGPEIAAQTDWPAKVQAIIERTVQRDIALIAGAPIRIVDFAEAFRASRAQAGAPVDCLQQQWPNLECCVHSGQPIGPYLSELRNLLGPSVNFQEVYAGAEGFWAAQDTATTGELRLFTHAGVFFEFLPLADYDEARLDVVGAKAVDISGVEKDVDYVVLLTLPSGLARYVVGDIVRFTSTEPPRLQYVGRTQLQLNAFGERVLEKHVTDALVAVCARHRWRIVNFHVAPLRETVLTGQPRGRHEWWVELRPGTVETPTGPQMALELDAELQRTHREYAARRAAAKIEAPYVRLVMPGVFAHWLQFRRQVGGEHRFARCRSDRDIADELAGLTRFARD